MIKPQDVCEHKVVDGAQLQRKPGMALIKFAAEAVDLPLLVLELKFGKPGIQLVADVSGLSEIELWR